MPRTPDPDAALFEQLRPRLTAISRRIVGSQADAEDIVQDSFIKWQHTERQTLATPAAWLTTVVRHGSIDHLRRRLREETALHSADAPAAEALMPTPEDRLLQRAELGAALARMLACLSPAERLALVLHEVFDCPHADIAAVLGARVDAARQHLARARRRLRQAVDRDDGTMTPDDKLCRDLIHRFHTALGGADIAAMTTLLGGEQPLFVSDAPQPRAHAGASANDVCYRLAIMA